MSLRTLTANLRVGLELGQLALTRATGPFELDALLSPVRLHERRRRRERYDNLPLVRTSRCEETEPFGRALRDDDRVVNLLGLKHGYEFRTLTNSQIFYNPFSHTTLFSVLRLADGTARILP